MRDTFSKTKVECNHNTLYVCIKIENSNVLKQKVMIMSQAYEDAGLKSVKLCKQANYILCDLFVNKDFIKLKNKVNSY